MKLHERKFETYKRNHRGESFEESETAKIHNEKNRVKILEKKIEKVFKRADLDNDDGLLGEIKALFCESKKIAKNLNTHKERLNVLQKNDNFR